MKFAPHYKKSVILVDDEYNLPMTISTYVANYREFIAECLDWLDSQNIKYIFRRNPMGDKTTFRFNDDNDRISFLLRWG